MRRSLHAVALLAALLLVGCVGPSRTPEDYRRKAANSAEAMISAAETAVLVAEVASEGSAPGPYVSLALTQAERDAHSIITSFGAVQPPGAASDELRDRVLDVLDRVATNLESLRIAALRHQHDRLVDLARPLRSDLRRLRELAQLAPV